MNKYQNSFFYVYFFTFSFLSETKLVGSVHDGCKTLYKNFRKEKHDFIFVKFFRYPSIFRLVFRRFYM